jgi:hypothetical protein
MHDLSEQIRDQVIAGVKQLASGTVVLGFITGDELLVRCVPDGPELEFRQAGARARSKRAAGAPTRRQQEYLAFIRRYMARYGRSPAETDIQRHFMVSAPSVNAMVRTLEARGFIARRRDFMGQTVPRSIRVLLED